MEHNLPSPFQNGDCLGEDVISPHVTGGPQEAVLIVLSLPKFCWAFLEADPLGLEDQVIQGWRCWEAALVTTMPIGSS